MHITGIIAEYDPFHNGHAHHITTVRDAGGTHIVAVISGSFTQRGEPAAFSKWDRAQMALRGGADLVLELPLPWSMASAEKFASGGVCLLRSLGCVDTISFGSECGDIELLKRLAAAPEDPAYRGALHQALSNGKTYAHAREIAAAAILGKNDAAVLRMPNNTLGTEYIRAARQMEFHGEFHTTQRIGAAHGSAGAGSITSAGHLRQMLAGDCIEKVYDFTPNPSAIVLKNACQSGRAPTMCEKLETALLARLRSMTVGEIRALPYVSEGLENRIARAVREATGYAQLLQMLNTRRYPVARLRRILWSALLNLRTDDYPELPPYIRILGFNGRGREILKAADPTLPLITKFSQLKALSADAQRVFRAECRATDIRALALPVPAACGTDLTTGCLRVE